MKWTTQHPTELGTYFWKPLNGFVHRTDNDDKTLPWTAIQVCRYDLPKSPEMERLELCALIPGQVMPFDLEGLEGEFLGPILLSSLHDI